MPRRQGFIGRETELASVLGLVATSADESPGVALISGEGGVGKTRVLDEMAARLPARTLICRGSGVGFLGGRIPYAPLVAALRSLLARLPKAEVPRVLGGSPDDLALLLPELGSAGESSSDQRRLIASVSSLLDRAAELRPTVLVLDDLHCADVASLEVLAYVAAAMDRQRLALVVAFRPDEVDEVLAEWLDGVRRASNVLEVTLQPMSLAETRAQLTDLLGGDPRSLLGEALTARIHARSGGNPYAAEALMRAALAGDEDSLPESLRDVLLRRTRACAPVTADVLRLIAAAGEQVPPRLLESALQDGAGGRDTTVHGTTHGPGALEDAVDEATRASLLVVQSDGRLSLRHALLGEALYADLTPRERRSLHARLVRALEDEPDVRPGVVAEHADLAGDHAGALVWSFRAAQEAEAIYAFDEAHRQYVRLRRVWPHVSDAEARVGIDAVEVFSQAANVAALCDHDTEAVELMEDVRGQLSSQADVDPVRLGLLEARYARLLLDCGRTEPALAAARRAVALVPADPPTAARSIVVSGLVHALDWAGDGGDWEPLADEAVEVARAVGDAAALARALIIRTTVHPGAPTLVDDAREAVGLALADGESELVGQAYSNLVDCMQCAGLGREGIDGAWAGIDAVSQRGLSLRYGSWLCAQGAEIALLHGWWDEADDLLTAAMAHTRHVQGANRNYVMITRARAAGLRGDWERLDADLAEVAQPPVVLQLFWREAVVESHLWRGNPEAAVSSVLEHAAALTPRLASMSAVLAWLGMRALGDVAELRRRSGGATAHDPSEALAQVDELVDRCCDDHALPGAAPVELALLCSAERSRVDLGGAGKVAAWERAVDGLTRVRRPYQRGYAHWRLALAQVADRDLPAAAGNLREASRLATRLGAAPLLAEVQAAARRTRIDLRPPQELSRTVLGAGGLLTPREREILGHLASGRTNGDIAKALVISTKTASVHVSNILRKLEVTSRYEAAALADRHLREAPRR